jgi:hypothetical protein
MLRCISGQSRPGTAPERLDPARDTRLLYKTFYGCFDGDRRADGAGAAELERAAARLEQLDRMTPAAGGQHLQLQRLTRLM